MRSIFCLTTKADWEQSQARGWHETPSLQSEGFIHASRTHQLGGVWRKHYATKPDVLLLRIDPALVKCEIKEEGKEVGNLFPHLYGRLNLDAVVGVFPIAAGTEFQLPEELSAELRT